MRTRTFVLAAALSAAGLATSLAQSNVYSLNIVGYVNQTYPANFSLAANPLKTAGNLISEVIPNPPDFSVVFAWDSATQTFQPGNVYNSFAGGWGNPNQVLDQGQGYFIQNVSGAAFTNTYVGEVVTSKTTTLAPALNLVGSAFPAEGTLDPFLQLPVPTGFDVVNIYNDGAGYAAPVNYNPFGGGWPGGAAPTLKVAQGMFYLNSGASKPWVQNFTVQ